MAATFTAYGQDGKTLVVYYSRTGNTEAVAKHIQELTGADLFRVETVKDYPADYRETTDVAKKELNDNARPEIKGEVANISGYDTVFIGFPIWWGTYPMGIASFLDTYDLHGKTVIPFCTHGGGGVDKGFTDVERETPGAVYKKGLSLSGTRAERSRPEVEKWLKEIDVIK